MHPNSMILMERFRDDYLLSMKGASILDIGSRRFSKHATYKKLFFKDYNYTGMDLEPGPNVDIVGYENIVDMYDVVISGQVMEHIARPWEWLKSLRKYYLKYICIIAPNSHVEHRFPIDTYRYFPDGMRDLFDYAGIKVIEVYRSKGDTVGIGSK